MYDELVDALAGLQIPENKQPSGQAQLAARNNNAGNLRYAGQKSATKGDKGFAKFATVEDGAQALYDQVWRDGRRGKTLQEFVTQYAPPHENDTAAYLARLTKALRAAPTTPLVDVDPLEVAKYVAKLESGTDLSGFTPKKMPTLKGNPAPVSPDMSEQPTVRLAGKKDLLHTLVPAIDALKEIKRRRANVKPTVIPSENPAPVRPDQTANPTAPEYGLAGEFGDWRKANQEETMAAFDPKNLGTDKGADATLNVLMGATTAPFDAAALQKLRNWGLVTAENVGGSQLPQAINDPRMKGWIKILKKLKLPTDIRTLGDYPSNAGPIIKDETSLIFPHITENTTRALARGVGQEAALVKRGYLNTTGELNPSTGLRPATPQDVAHFTLPSGEKLTSEIDWSQSLKAKPLTLDHYSPVNGLTEVDPAMMGTGRAGAERARPNRPEMTHFYKSGTQPERMFSQDHLYRAQTTDPVLDLGNDIDNMSGRIADSRKGGIPADYFENMLEDVGFGGYRSGDIIKLFGKHPLKQLRSVLASTGAGAAAGAATQNEKP